MALLRNSYKEGTLVRMNPPNRKQMTIPTTLTKRSESAAFVILFASFFSIFLFASCRRINRPQEILFSENREGYYSCVFEYNPIEADRFWASMTLIKSGISPSMLDCESLIKLKHIDGGVIKFQNDKKLYKLEKSEEILIYQGRLRLVDNDSKSEFLSYHSDSRSNFEVIIESKIANQNIAARWAYKSGG
jgi:hypothetical protein